VVLAAAAVLAAATGLPICDLLFDCGCTWPLLGAADHCNIHQPRPPHCPICASTPLGLVYAAALLTGWAAVAWLAGKAVRRSG
jgi:hypothetical protein